MISNQVLRPLIETYKTDKTEVLIEDLNIYRAVEPHLINAIIEMYNYHHNEVWTAGACFVFLAICQQRLKDYHDWKELQEKLKEWKQRNGKAK